MLFHEEKEVVQVWELERFVDNSVIKERAHTKVWEASGSSGDGSGATPDPAAAADSTKRGGKKGKNGKGKNKEDPL